MSAKYGQVDRTDIEKLIARVALGDRNAFSDLYDATSGKLFAVCLRVLNQRSQAEDAMQDAYVKIWKSADRFRVTSHSPMSWLITIARNSAIDLLRTTRPGVDISIYENTIAAPGLTPEQAAVAASEAARLTKCLDELPKDRRDAIIGAYLGGASYRELATQYDVPINTMRTWLRRGRSRPDHQHHQ